MRKPERRWSPVRRPTILTMKRRPLTAAIRASRRVTDGSRRPAHGSADVRAPDHAYGLASPDATWDDRRVPNTEPLHVQLNVDERAVLRAGLLDWGGPARPTDALAVAMGFTDAAALPREAWALWEQIDRSSSLTADDWRRVLLAVEFVFVSDVVARAWTGASRPASVT
jgi:hypothetical protein